MLKISVSFLCAKAATAFRRFYGFFGDFGLRHKSIIIHKVAPRNYCYAIQIENLVFVYYLNVNTPIFS